MGRCTSPPPPLGQRGSRFRGPFFETNNISILTSIAYAKRMERHSVAKRIPAGSEDLDYWPTTNGFVAVEDEGDQGSQSLSIAPNIKLEDIKLAEQAADTAITFQAPQRSVSSPHFLDVADHAPQKSLSPPHFFEMKDRRVGASRQLQRRPACRCRPLASHQFVQRRSIKMDFLASRQLVQCRSIAKRIPAGSEDVDHCPTTNGFVAVEDEGDQGRQSLSITPNKKVEDIKLAEQAADTAITFQTRLAPYRSVSPPHLLEDAEHAPQKSISPLAFFELKDIRVGASRQLQRRPACRCRPLASRQFVQRRSIKMDFLSSHQLVQRRSIAKRIPAGSEDVDHCPTTNGFSIAKRIPAGSEDVDHCPTTNGFVSVEDEGDQGRQSLSIAPNIKLQDIKLDEQAADTAITFQTRLAPQRSVSPPHFLDVAEHAPQRSITPPPFFEMKDRRVGAILARCQLVQRRYKSGDFASLIENGGGEERNYRTDNSSNASVDAITCPYQEAPPPKSTRSPVPLTTRTTVDFTARLAPPPARRQRARGLISSIFKKKRQMEIFASPIEKEQSVEVEPRPTSFGLAHIFSYGELKDATSCFKQQIGGGGFSSVYLVLQGTNKPSIKGDFYPLVLAKSKLKLAWVERLTKGTKRAINELSRLPHFFEVAELAAGTAITSPTWLAPERSVSPPPLFEMKDRRAGAILARRKLVQPRYKAGRFGSLIENGGREERNYGVNHSTTRTTVGFATRLAPPPARKQTATGLIASIFKKNRQMESFVIPVEKKQSVEVEPGPTSFGLARIFSYEELKEATSCFKQQIGDGGFSSVYLGKLPDQRIVAVKVLYEGIPKRFEQFINEVTVLSRLRHKNLVVLYGCTDPETKKLLLVYEFMPNGTIADHLHGKRPPLTWALRIQMAIETAEALAYLHSLEPPIIHRDVKTSNILLDNDFHVKVADLGMCRLLPWDSKSVTTQPQGTQGYRDPEYELYCNLTDKSDVYSFGVVLLELLSGQQAVDVNREKNDIYLFRMALNMILNKELEQLVDPKLGYHSDCEIKRMVDLVAELACNCLQPEADMRPSMLDVVSALKKIYNDM